MKRLLRPGIVTGLVVFILSILFMLFVAAPLQAAWGLIGMVWTELGFLLIGGVVVLLGKWNLKEVFPLEKVSLKKVTSIIPLYIGTILLVNTVSLIQGYIFPDSTLVGGEIVDFYNGAPFIIALICIAVLPAICEEFLHRGVILFAVKRGMNDVWIAFFMALLFGIFHLSIYRFFPTAIIGFSLSFLFLKSKNILLPIVFHFINNAITVIIAYQTPNTTSIGVPLYVVGFYLLACVFVPISYYLAVRMLSDKKIKNRKEIGITVVATIFFMITGGITSYRSVALQPTVNILYEVKFTQELKAEDFGDSDTIIDEDSFFTIEEAEEYHFYFKASGGSIDARAGVTVLSQNGEEIWWMGGGEVFADKGVILTPGEYSYHFDYYLNQETPVPMEIEFQVYTIQ